jgi:hypothetical protein
MASPFFPSPIPSNTEGNTETELRRASISKVSAIQPTFGFTMSDTETEQLIRKMKDATKNILETYILDQSPKEINIIARIRKSIIAEINSGNYHPDVFKSAFEHIGNLLRTNSLPKFLKTTE